LLTPRGIDLLDVYSGGDGGVTGSMRLAREAGDGEGRARVGQVRQQMARSRKADGAKAQSSNGRGGIRTGARN
jgi:hypothetical protein